MNQDREEARRAIEEMAAEGRLTAENVVEAARDEDSPLHGYFEWDVKEAAKAHWLEQARQLIRSFKITIQVHQVTIKAPAFVPDVKADEGYVGTVSLRSDEDRARETVIAEVNRAMAALQRARAIAIALDMAEIVDDAMRATDRAARMFEAHAA